MRYCLCVLGSLILTVPAQAGERDIQARTVFYGVVKDLSLRKLAPSARFIVEAGEFETLWKEWKPIDMVPRVDFSRDFVLVITDNKGKPDRFLLKLDANGDLSVGVGYTDAKDFPGFGFGIAQVPREGIKTFEGRPIKKKKGKANWTARTPGRI